MDPLAQLEQIAGEYGGDAAEKKLALLVLLARARLRGKRRVSKLHEILCLLRAYPDDRLVRDQVEAMLARFPSRPELRAHRNELRNTGIAGTLIEYRFYWVMARWLATRWPEALSIDWEKLPDDAVLERLLPVLLPSCEGIETGSQPFSVKRWIEALKGPGETDATFLIRRIDALPMSEALKENLFESIDAPMRFFSRSLRAPSRSRAHHPSGRVFYQRSARSHARPRLEEEVKRPPIAVRTPSRRDREALVDLAREAMVTRSRDLDAIAYASSDDVTLVDCGDGLSFACLGVIPERRFLLETIHVFITLKNGVPIGYFQASSLFGSSELNYNIFEPFRGAEASVIYGRAVAMVHALLGSDVFAVDPYQLGDGNAEAIATGAFWFYYKLGYRSEDPSVLRVLDRELAKIARNPAHRSSAGALQKLSVDYVYFYLHGRRDDVAGKVSTHEINLAVSRELARRFGADRERGLEVTSKELMDLLGVRSLRGFSAGEREAWTRFSALITVLPEVRGFSAADKALLVQMIRAKGARSEIEYGHRCRAHLPFRRALLKLLAAPLPLVSPPRAKRANGSPADPNRLERRSRLC